MTMHASIHGRAAFDPRQTTTKSGKPMTTCRLAVDVTGHNQADEQTLWVDLLAFGHQAEDLARVEKGQMVSAMGRVTRGTFTGRDGTERESWTLLADSVLTVRSARPGQRRRAQEAGPQGDTAGHGASFAFNDPIGF